MANSGGFNFGGAPSATSTPFSLGKAATAPAGGFSFGGATPGQPAATTQAAGGGFSFGGSALGQPAATTQAPAGGFSFGGTTPAASTQASGGLGFGAATGQATGQATSQPAGFNLGGLGAPGTGGFSLGGTAASTAAPGLSFGGATQNKTAGFSLGGATSTSAPASTGTLSGLLASTQPTSTPGLGGLGLPKTTAAGVTFGGTTQLGATSTAATTQPATGFGFGGLAKTTAAATTPAGFGFSTPATTGLGGTTAASASGFTLGAKPPLQSGLTIGAAGLNIGQTSTAGGSIFGQTTTKAQVTGLGGVDPKTSTATSGGTSTEAKPGDGKSLKESQLPPEITGTVEEFQKYVKSEKAVQDDLSRSSTKPLYKVQEDVVALKQLLSVVSNGLQRNAVVIDKLKHEMTQELKNAEMTIRTKETPPGLQYDNTAPTEYFQRLVEDFENQMMTYRQQIETLEEHLASTHQPNKLTPDDLILLLRKLHETFIALAAQLHQVHESVKVQKEHYLNYRKIFLHDTKNIFETEKKPVHHSRPDTATHLGPTPFGGLSNAAAVAMASALTRSQQPAAGPPVSGLAVNLGQTTGFGSTGLFGAAQPGFGGTASTQSGFGGFGSTATTQAGGFKGFGGGFGTTTTTQSTGFGGFGASTATVRPLGFGTTTTASGLGTSTFGQTGSLFGASPAVGTTPAFGTTGDTFQLNKPPTSKKKR